MLEVKNLMKTFTTVKAVNDVSFAVRPGSVFGLLGPNGAGKTTTIRMILNIIRPDTGEILFDGAPFSPALRNNIGYLPEERGLYRKHKLLSTIQYFAGLKGLNPAESKRRASRWLERFQLLPYTNNKIEELSKGNQQKVQFIVSVLHDPRYIILDEPFSGLDPVNQIVLRDIIEELQRAGKIIIFSTHQMEQAEKMCDEVCIINKGRIVLYGPLAEEKKKLGTNNARIEFEGEGSVIRSIRGIRNLSLYSNFAEFEIEPAVNLHDLLSELVRRVAIRKFEIQEPSLNAIFLRLVGATVEEVEKEHQQRGLGGEAAA